MERLTRKSLEYKDTWIANGSLSNIKGVVRGDAIDRLGELEDVLEKYGIENLEEYISALIEARKFSIEESKINFKRHIEETTKREKLEQQLAELKQKAIVPKFEIGQEVYIINKYYYKKHWCVEKNKIVGIEDKIDRKEKYVRWYTLTYGDIKLGNRYKFQEKDIFATKEEAEQKLTEIKGEKDE